MVKVFLVEDEAIIRRGIKKNVEWEKNGFEFVGAQSMSSRIGSSTCILRISSSIRSA